MQEISFGPSAPQVSVCLPCSLSFIYSFQMKWTDVLFLVGLVLLFQSGKMCIAHTLLPSYGSIYLIIIFFKLLNLK